MKLFPLFLKVFLFLLFVFDNDFFEIVDLGLFIFVLLDKLLVQILDFFNFILQSFVIFNVFH